MASLGPIISVTVLLISFFLFPSHALYGSADADAIVVPSPQVGGRNRHTMFLPLFQSSPNLSPSLTAFKSRRHLQKSESRRPAARMDLHDDLLLNGYYTTRLWIGTPPQRFALIVDTGSTVTYVPCSTCEQCGKHQDPKFQPEMSSTYRPVKCNVACTCDSDGEQCIYERQYAEMSSSSGVLGEDIISFGNQSELAPQRATFGCENVETGDLYSQHADGIMGLGRGDLSVVDQLVDKGVINDSFSLCYGGMGIGGGAMVLGGITPPADMVFTRSDPIRSPYYNIELKEIHVAGKRLSLDPSVFDRRHGTVLDSGTTYAYLPGDAFIAFKNAIIQELHSLQQIRGPDPSYHDICFSGAGSDDSQLSKTFPVVDMVFGNGQKLSLSPENYLFRHSKVRGAYCLGIFPSGKDPSTLLGGIIVRNILVNYDREHEIIGFWRTNCSELWERLHVSHNSSPISSDMNKRNSTRNIAPTMPPSEPPLYAFPGEIKVGLITFYLSLSIKSLDLKPHIFELAEFIAKDLDVDLSQVRLLTFTAEDDRSITSWQINPAGSVGYISNATAMGIISRLAEHRLRLPETFGSYHLFKWNVAPPPPQRTWWQRNHFIVVVAVVVTLVFGLLVSGAWFFWSRRQSMIPYEPVGLAVPEQELQPL